MSVDETTHAIFDMGGTVFSAESLVNLYQEMLKRSGNPIQLSPEMIKIFRNVDRFKKSAFDALIDIVLEEVGIEVTTDTSEKYKKLLMEAFFEVGLRLSPGVDRLLKHLQSKGIPIAIATNGSQIDIDIVGKVIPGYDPSIFSHITGGANNPEVANNKPAPDIYLVCAQKFATPPKSVRNCVIFEDSLTGITGAVASGMKTVLINNRRDNDFDSIASKVTVIVDSFMDFRPESVGLPAY